MSVEKGVIRLFSFVFTVSFFGGCVGMNLPRQALTKFAAFGVRCRAWCPILICGLTVKYLVPSARPPRVWRVVSFVERSASVENICCRCRGSQEGLLCVSRVNPNQVIFVSASARDLYCRQLFCCSFLPSIRVLRCFAGLEGSNVLLAVCVFEVLARFWARRRENCYVGERHNEMLAKYVVFLY